VSIKSIDDILVLTCISFLFHYVFPVIIYNQCPDFELVSPVYFSSNITWHIPPDRKVDANAMIKAGFAKDLVKEEFASALVYKLQRKKRIESNTYNTFIKDTKIGLLHAHY
jgi:hypothetical protein